MAFAWRKFSQWGDEDCGSFHKQVLNKVAKQSVPKRGSVGSALPQDRAKGMQTRRYSVSVLTVLGLKDGEIVQFIWASFLYCSHF